LRQLSTCIRLVHFGLFVIAESTRLDCVVKTRRTVSLLRDLPGDDA
jgi:hypothetical protein